MAYAKKAWATGDVITADALNNLENGVAANDARTLTPGPKGDKGDAGVAGPQGPKGDKGDKGDSGLTPQAAIADVAAGADAAALVTAHNAVLAALRKAGVIAAK